MREKPSDLALQKAAGAWCREKTKNTEMDVDLATEFAKLLDDYIEALVWCSGASDFAPEGKAREGWEKIVAPLIKN
jgi:hypothetical protein